EYPLALQTALIGITAGVFLAAVAWLWRHRAFYDETLKHIIFFGPVWYVLTVFPLMLAHYRSARHLYLTASGNYIALAFLIMPVSAKRPGRSALASVMTAVFLAGFFRVTLVRCNNNWIDTGRRSGVIMRELVSALESIPRDSHVVLYGSALRER